MSENTAKPTDPINDTRNDEDYRQVITRLRMQATAEQVERFHLQCDVNELLRASTLSKRIEGMTATESQGFIVEWFKTVRQMGIAAHLTSGIKLDVVQS